VLFQLFFVFDDFSHGRSHMYGFFLL